MVYIQFEMEHLKYWFAFPSPIVHLADGGGREL